MKSNRLCLAVAAILFMTLVACKSDPDAKKQKYLESGNLHLANKQYPEALADYQNAIQLDPQFAEAHYQLAKANIGLMDASAALLELRKTVSLRPDDMRAQVDLGSLYLGMRNYQDAEQVAMTMLEKAPGNASGHELMANVDFAKGKIAEAQVEFDKALQLEPNKATLQFSVGNFKARTGNTAEADARFRKALELDPKLVIARLALAELLASSQKFDAVENLLKEGIAVDPQSTTLYKVLAHFYQTHSRHDDAIQLLTNAKKILQSDPNGYRILGDFYTSTGDMDNARTEFASLVSAHPKEIAIRLTYINLLFASNRLQEAGAAIDEILKENNKDSQAIVLKAKLLNLQEKPADALALLSPNLKDLSTNAAARLEQGIAYNKLGESSCAETEFREAVKLDPNLVEAQNYMAAIGLQRSNSDLLRSSADAIIKQRPDAAIGYIYRAAAEMLQRDISGAETDLKRAIEMSPNDPTAYIKLGMLRGFQKQYPEAVKMFETALAKDSNASEALIGIVNTNEALKQPAAKSIVRINAQIAKAPQNDAYWTLLARMQIADKDKKSAKASLQKALEMNHNSATALTMLAELQASQGDLNEASVNYQKLIDLNPRSATPFIMLALLEQSRGNFDRAQQLYQKGLGLDPNQPVAANNLAYIMLERGGNTDVALSYAQIARRAMPNNASTGDTLGWAYYRKGLYGSARDTLETAAKAAPENAAIQYHLGMTYDKISEKSKSTDHLKKALKLAPEGPYAAAIRQVLSSSGSKLN